MSAPTNQKELKQIRREQKFKSVAATLTVLFAAMFLSACGNKPLNENKIAQLVPEDILKYSLNGTTNIMTVKNITIDKRQTNEKEDIVYAVIDMEDSYVHRTAYYMFTINYWDKGGWMLEKSKKYQDTISYPLNCPAENKANDVISKQYKGYTFKSVDTHDLKSGNCAYIFDINDVKRYATTSGQAEVIFSINSGDVLNWSSSINSSGLEVKWDIAGKWTASLRGVFQAYYRTVEASVNIIKDTNATFRINGNLIDSTGYSSDRNFLINDELDYDNKNQQLSAIYEMRKNMGEYCKFQFSADEARLVCYNSMYGPNGSYSNGLYNVMSRTGN